jgi:hypothetical protein
VGWEICECLFAFSVALWSRMLSVSRFQGLCVSVALLVEVQ